MSRTKFENEFRTSATNDMFIYKLRDVFIPTEYRSKIKLPKNYFDLILFKTPILLLLELKSSGEKSISFDEKIIKKHQIDSLERFNQIPYVFSGFVLNYRNYNNSTYFVYIDDFIRFKKETSKKSISLTDCQEIGLQIENKIKKSRYIYDLEKFIEDVQRIYL